MGRVKDRIGNSGVVRNNGGGGGKRDLIANRHPSLLPSTHAMHGHYFGPSNNTRALSAMHIYRRGEIGCGAARRMREGGKRVLRGGKSKRDGWLGRTRRWGRDGSTTRWITPALSQEINRSTSCVRHPSIHSSAFGGSKRALFRRSNRWDGILKCEKEEGAKYSNLHLSHPLYGHEFIMRRETNSKAARVEYAHTERRDAQEGSNPILMPADR